MNRSLPDIEHSLLAFYRTGAPASPAARVHDLRAISDGWENEVYSFALVDETAAGPVRKELILRIYPGSDAPRKSAREFDGMRRLYEAGFPVPEVLWLELDPASFGQPFVIMERIAGRSIDQAYSAAPAAGRQELLTLFCRLLVDLHGLEWRSVLSPAAVVTDDTPAIMQLELSWMQEKGRSLGQGEFDPAFEWLRERFSSVQWGPPCLIHGDYHGENILIRDDGAPFVIDWGNIRVSDRRADLGWTLMLASTYGNPEMRAPILAEYERLAGCPMEDMDFFDAAACSRRLLSICGALDQGADQLGMHPGAEGQMRNAPHIRSVYEVLRDRTGIRLPRIEALLAALG